ncbi:MAG: iron-containing alcohol dehydrogenase, partial [Actinomycetota bacterium]|nr:iron-containing alcohol dehydrogenase [Actinomycetota bacterium]
LGIERPLVVTTKRWSEGNSLLLSPVGAVFDGVRPHVPAETVEAAAGAARGHDGLVGLGGGSAIDTAKAASARTRLPVVSVPTTYSGAEWTSGFGVRDEERGVKAGGSGACLAGIVYEPELTLSLPRAETGGTALNALAHCAEALYVDGRNDEADRAALAGAARIVRALPAVLADGDDREARRLLLEGAMHAGAALAGAGLGLAHAMAQALGGRFGIPHGAANALCLPPALRFNEPVAGEALARLASALETDEAAARSEALARLAGFRRLRDLGVPEGELEAVAEAAVLRAGARANPRPASPADVLALLRSVW